MSALSFPILAASTFLKQSSFIFVQYPYHGDLSVTIYNSLVQKMKKKTKPSSTTPLGALGYHPTIGISMFHCIQLIYSMIELIEVEFYLHIFRWLIMPKGLGQQLSRPPGNETTYNDGVSDEDMRAANTSPIITTHHIYGKLTVERYLLLLLLL